MQGWYSLREIRGHARHLLQQAIATCDARYAALPTTARAADADGVDAKLAATEADVWKNADAAARSIVCLKSIADHLRHGVPIKDAAREPDLSNAAMMLRQARMSGAMGQERVDALAAELDNAVRDGTNFATRLVAELKGLALTLAMARANQRMQWLRRCAQANPDADLCGEIRDAEKHYAAAKLAVNTHRSEARS
ncbi:hypothetical protein [Cupriavidus pauculus]|uniref:Uncharacterized protein n=1 Tax=Cupriavidus pauculus TaxID=82633 RepID=A0A2N5C910_9BURK|nr:hypothetical protein [Cupriavidus pauculus]PLP98707.1 hypothetical protein CYJ10_20620 [Cupriavidus pauculus]